MGTRTVYHVCTFADTDGTAGPVYAGRTCVWMRGQWNWVDSWPLSQDVHDYDGVPTIYSYVSNLRGVDRSELELLWLEGQARKVMLEAAP